MEKTIEIPEWLLNRAVRCLARAEAEKAFANCVVPAIGSRTLAALESYQRKETK